MKWFCLISVFVLILFSQRNASSETPQDQPKATIIPLDQIWGYEMPGTRDIRELEPKRQTGNMPTEEVIRGSLILQIRQALGNRPKAGEQAGPALVVVGTGKEALKNAHAAIMAKDKKESVPIRQQLEARVLPFDAELSVVFYSYMCGRYVRIISVEQSEKLITVKYQLVSHITGDMTIHFALIPLGKLHQGAVQVKIMQVPSVNTEGQRATPLQNVESIICDGFTFAVEK